MALARYTPQLLTFALYVSGLWHKELYLLLFGLGMSFDGILNWLLNSSLSGSVGPRVSTCVPVHGAVLSYESQQMAFFVTFALGYIILYEAGARIWHLVLLIGLFCIVFLGDHMLNYHTVEAIVAATTLGTLAASIYQWMLYFLFVPAFPFLARQWLVRWIGYEDTLCYTNSTSALGRYVLAAYDKRFGDERAPLTRIAMCELVRSTVIEYLAREHSIYSEMDLMRIQPLLVCRVESDSEPLTFDSGRQFIEEHL